MDQAIEGLRSSKTPASQQFSSAIPALIKLCEYISQFVGSSAHANGLLAELLEPGKRKPGAEDEKAVLTLDEDLKVGLDSLQQAAAMLTEEQAFTYSKVSVHADADSDDSGDDAQPLSENLLFGWRNTSKDSTLSQSVDNRTEREDWIQARLSKASQAATSKAVEFEEAVAVKTAKIKALQSQLTEATGKTVTNVAQLHRVTSENSILRRQLQAQDAAGADQLAEVEAPSSATSQATEDELRRQMEQRFDAPSPAQNRSADELRRRIKQRFDAFVADAATQTEQGLDQTIPEELLQLGRKLGHSDAEGQTAAASFLPALMGALENAEKAVKLAEEDARHVRHEMISLQARANENMKQGSDASLDDIRRDNDHLRGKMMALQDLFNAQQDEHVRLRHESSEMLWVHENEAAKQLEAAEAANMEVHRLQQQLTEANAQIIELQRRSDSSRGNAPLREASASSSWAGLDTFTSQVVEIETAENTEAMVRKDAEIRALHSANALAAEAIALKDSEIKELQSKLATAAAAALAQEVLFSHSITAKDAEIGARQEQLTEEWQLHPTDTRSTESVLNADTEMEAIQVQLQEALEQSYVQPAQFADTIAAKDDVIRSMQAQLVETTGKMVAHFGEGASAIHPEVEALQGQLREALKKSYAQSAQFADTITSKDDTIRSMQAQLSEATGKMVSQATQFAEGASATHPEVEALQGQLQEALEKSYAQSA